MGSIHPSHLIPQGRGERVPRVSLYVRRIDCFDKLIMWPSLVLKHNIEHIDLEQFRPRKRKLFLKYKISKFGILRVEINDFLALKVMPKLTQL